jgi:basic amino acid/polyamine antiporter, APA family
LSSGTKENQQVFLRNATGLIRDFAMIDAVIFAIGAMIGPTWVPIFESEWFVYPGVSIPASLLIIGVLALANGAYYVFITSVMPRSGGGSYVPLSRLVSPIIGMGMTTILVVAFLLDMGYIGNITFTVGVSSPLATYASITNNSALTSLANSMATPTTGFILGTIFLILVGLLAVSGNRWIKLANKVTFAIGTIGMLVIIGVLATTSQATFQTAFNNFAGAGMYQNITATAHTNGWNPNVNFLSPTFLSLPLSFFAIAGYAFNTYYGGEVRKVSRTMSIAVVGSIFFTAAIFSIIAQLAQNAFGSNFITSAGYLASANGGANWHLSVQPFVNTFVAMVNSNPLVNAILIASFICWGYLLIINYYFISSRHFLAWSFDRSVPSFLGSVSDRFHSPVVALAICGFIGWIALGLYAFLPAYVGAVNLTFFFVIAFLLDGLAGIALWRKPALMDSAPAFVKRKVGGVPLISLLGIYSVILMVYLFIASLENPLAIGAFGDATLIPTVGAFIVGAVSYLGMRQYYKGKGLDIGLAFREIPPE